MVEKEALGYFSDKRKKEFSRSKCPYLSVKEAEDGGHQKTLKKKNRVSSELRVHLLHLRYLCLEVCFGSKVFNMHLNAKFIPLHNALRKSSFVLLQNIRHMIIIISC